MTKQTSSRRVLLALAVLGFAAGGWALFLWWQLLRARAGFEPVCLGDAGGCGALWDGAMASFVQRRTGLPVAAWGVVWGLAATVLPLRVLARGEDGDQDAGGVRWTAAFGLVGVVGLLAASAAAGQFCGSCALTYLLTGAYGVLALVSLGVPTLASGLATFAVTTGLAWLILLYPGLQTPKSLEDEGRQALMTPIEEVSPGADRAAPEAPSDHSHDEHAGHDHGPIEVPEVDDDHPLLVRTWPLDSAEQTQRLATFLGGLEPRVQQALFEMLAQHRASPVFALSPPRDLFGPADATTRIVDFTDTLCGHCAQLAADLAFLRKLFPPAAFSVDSRHYPLDGNCNPHLPIRGPEQVRCMAARARICLEGNPGRKVFEKKLYDHQHELTPEKVTDLASPYLGTSELEACLASEATAKKLRSDVDDAAQYSPTGTPLLLVGGRQTQPFGPLLYALILAGGDTDHPAFSGLQAP